MADNTTLNPGAGGDIVRTVARNTSTPTVTTKTQVLQIDVGGDTTDYQTESIVTNVNPMPVQTPDHDITNSLLVRSLALQIAQMNLAGAGFVPIETPDFLLGV